MKALLVSFVVGLVVGIAYGIIRVKSLEHGVHERCPAGASARMQK